MGCDEEQLQILRRCAPLDDKRICEYHLNHRQSGQLGQEFVTSE